MGLNQVKPSVQVTPGSGEVLIEHEDSDHVEHLLLSDDDARTLAIKLLVTDGESNLAAHARHELERCGQAAEDPVYAESIVAAVAAFASYHHSGGSAAVAQEQLRRLLAFEPLSPLTDDPAEWIDRSVESGRPFWQSARDSKAFSEDGGKTYWTLEDHTVRASERSER